MFPYVTGKNFLFRFLVKFAGVFWIGLMSVNREYRTRNSLIASSVLVFTFIAGLADLFGINPYNSFWSNYERMEGYVTIVHLALFFMIIKSIFKTNRDWMVFFSICLAASVLVSLFALIEPSYVELSDRYISEYGTRISGTIGNPPFLASYLLLSVFVGIILIQIVRRKHLKFLCVVFVIINSVIIYKAASRGVIIAAFIGMIISGIFYLTGKSGSCEKRRFRRIFPYLLGLMIVSSAVVMLVNHTDDRTLSRIMMISLDDPSIRTRLYSWEMAWNGFKENPFLGWGQENFLGVYTVNPSPLKGFIWMDRAHNIVLDWLINAGLMGLFAYLAMFGSAFYVLQSLHKKKVISRNRALIISGMLVVYFIQNLFTFDTINTYIIFFALLAYIDNIESAKESLLNASQDNSVPQKKIMVSVSITLSALIVIASISYFVDYLPFKQLQAYTRITRSISEYDSYSSMLDDFEKALSYNSFGDEYVRDAMQSVSYQLIDYQLYDKKGAGRLIKRTLEEMEKGLAANHYNLEYMTRAVYFYKLLAEYDPSYVSIAEALIKECARINPRYTRLEMAKADILIIKKDFKKAFQVVKKIADSQWTAVTQFKLALAAVLVSNDDTADEALENVRRIRVARNKDIAEGDEYYLSSREMIQLARACMEVEKYDMALQYYRKTLAVIPEEKKYRTLKTEDMQALQARIYFKMARAYVFLGDRKSAEKAAEKAAELDPVRFRKKADGL